MHTSPAEVIPDPEPSVNQPGPQPEHPKDDRARPRRLRGWMIITGAVVVLGIVAFVFVGSRTKTPAIGTSAASASTNASQVLRLKGTTEAVQSRAILAPLLAGQSVPTLTIIHLTTAGTRVKQGDLLVEFDRQAQMRDFVDKQADYAKLVDQVAEEQAKENAARAKDETETNSRSPGHRYPRGSRLARAFLPRSCCCTRIGPAKRSPCSRRS